MNFPPLYIGDGVYASHDGFQFWLSTHDHQHRIALEPAVLSAFFRYIEQVHGCTITVDQGNKTVKDEDC